MIQFDEHISQMGGSTKAYEADPSGSLQSIQGVVWNTQGVPQTWGEDDRAIWELNGYKNEIKLDIKKCVPFMDLEVMWCLRMSFTFQESNTLIKEDPIFWSLEWSSLMSLPTHLPPKGRIHPSKSPLFFWENDDIGEWFPEYNCNFKAKLQPPKSRWKGQDLCKFPDQFWYFDKATQPYQRFPIISIFDMCTAREDCSDFFLILVHDFLYLQLKCSADTTVHCKKIQHPTTLPSFHCYVPGLTLNLVAVGRFQQKQTVEHLEGLVIGTGIPGVESQGWRNGCFKSETVRGTYVACIDGVFVPMLRWYFLHIQYGLFGFAICGIHIYIYIHIHIPIHIYRILICCWSYVQYTYVRFTLN